MDFQNLEIDTQESASKVDKILETREVSGASLTLNTVVTITPERAESVHSNYAKYRTSPITFEDYFAKSGTQRRFYSRLLRFQAVLNFTASTASIFSTVLTDQAWFLRGSDDLLNALLLHTAILSTMMLFVPFLTYKLRKWKPGNRDKRLLEVLMRMYQASLLTFWYAFAVGKYWKSNDGTVLSLVPLLYLPCAFYVINFLTQIAALLLLRYTTIQITSYVPIAISLALSSVILTLALPLVHCNVIGRGYATLDTLQLIVSAIFSAIECSLIFCTCFKTNMDTSDEGEDMNTI